MKMLLKLFLILLLIYCYSIFAQYQIHSIQELKTPLQNLWSYKLNSPILNAKFNEDVCYINTLNGIHAISLSTGNTLWDYSFPDKPTISSVVTFTNKYGAFLTYSYNEDEEKGLSSIYVIDLSNGKEIFVEKSDKILYKPTVYIHEDKLYCIGGEPDDWLPLDEFIELELDEANLFKFDIQTKKLISKQMLSDEKSEIIDIQQGYLFLGYDYDYDSSTPKNKIKCYSLDKFKLIFDYNPSGIISKSLISRVEVKDNVAYLFPPPTRIGIIASVNLTDGKEIMNESYVGADNVFFKDNLLFTYSIGEEKYLTLISWYVFDLNKNEKLFSKKLSSSTKIELGDLFGAILGRFLGPYALLAASPLLFLKDSKVPSFIPSKYLFYGLNQFSIHTGSNLVGLYQLDEETIIKISKPIEDDETSTEIKFEPKVDDLRIANFYTPNRIFITYGGKVASIDLNKGEQDWVGDFNINEPSLGLIYHNNFYYLLTIKGLHKLTSNN